MCTLVFVYVYYFHIGGQNMNGKELDKYIRETYNLSPDDKITPKQLDYVLTLIDPVHYVLKHHTIKGNPITFDIPNFDTSRAVAHRPWQKGILRASASDDTDVCVIKSRQLGLSELSVASMIYWLDTHSKQGVKALYAFPTHGQMQDFYKTRIQPLFTSDYYSTLVDPKEMSMQLLKIRDTSLFMRSHNKPSTMEG